MNHEKEAAVIVERLIQEYDRSVSALRAALKAFLTDGTRPDPNARIDGSFAYPELRLHWSGDSGYPRISRAYARIGVPGSYATTVTRPAMFRDYLVEQLALLIQDFDIEFDAEVLDQQGQLLDQIVTEHGRAGDGGRVAAGHADAGVGAADTRITAVAAPVQPKLGIGEGAIDPRVGIGSCSVCQEGFEGGPKGGDGSVVFLDKPFDDDGCFFLMVHGYL